MHRLYILTLACLMAAGTAAAQADRDFSGSWKLDRSRGNIGDTSVPVDPSFRVEQSAASLTIIAEPANGGSAIVSIYPLDGRSQKYQNGNLQKSSATKWEGSALLVNTIVSGPGSGPSANSSTFERWSRSRDGNTLTITRNVTRVSGETESVLVYVNPTAPPEPLVYFNSGAFSKPEVSEVAPAQIQPTPRTFVTRPAPMTPTTPDEYIVPAGTHILLRLTNPVNTKTTVTGDRIYLETAIPIFVNGRVVIPQGSYVNGSITDAKSAGRVKGKAELALQYDSITLRSSGASRDLRSRPDSVGTIGSVDKTEGRIQSESSKGEDAGRVATTTAIGTGVGAAIGSAAGHVGAGAGLGAAGGAIAGLASVFGSRGKQVVLPAGTTMDMTLDRDLRFTAEELRVQIR